MNRSPQACAQVFLGNQDEDQRFCPSFVFHPYVDGVCVNDADLDGICDEFEVPGCTDSGACNYDSAATDDDSSCEYLTCAGCTDDAAATTTRLPPSKTVLALMRWRSTTVRAIASMTTMTTASATVQIPGCTDVEACNFDQEATDLDNSCVYPGAPCDDGNSR